MYISYIYIHTHISDLHILDIHIYIDIHILPRGWHVRPQLRRARHHRGHAPEAKTIT